MKKSILIVPFYSYVSLLILCSVNSNPQSEPVHKVEILSSQILHGYFGYGFPICQEKLPILHIEFDIGSMCLYMEDKEGSTKFTVGADPECNGNLCAGPRGPISMWTKSKVVKSIIYCISNHLKDGESIEDYTPKEFKEKFNLNKIQRVTGRGAVPKQVMNLKVEDRNDTIMQVLPNEADIHMEIVHTKLAKGEIVLVSVENVLPKPMSFCVISGGTTNVETANVFLKFCTSDVVTCTLGNGNHDQQHPGKWSFEDLKTQVMVCLTRYFAKIGRPLNFKKQRPVSNNEYAFAEIRKVEL